MQPRNYGFDENLSFSDDDETVIAIKSTLLSGFPDAVRVTRATRSEDRAGTDFWVHIDGGRKISIDAKVRRVDWYKAHGKDDLALETWSVVEEGIVGWTRNTKKRTDYVLWYWIDTGRHALLPFMQLVFVMQQNWETWMREYEHYEQRTSDDQFRGKGDYHSEAVMVPKDIVMAAINAQYTSDYTIKPTVIADEHGRPKPKGSASFDYDFGKEFYVRNASGSIRKVEWDGTIWEGYTESDVPYGKEIISEAEYQQQVGSEI